MKTDSTTMTTDSSAMPADSAMMAAPADTTMSMPMDSTQQ
jgi:hypothetical protein